MTVVKLKLRNTVLRENEAGDLVRIRPQYDEVNLDRLSPRARALAEAVAASHDSAAGFIWVESDRPVRELRPDWQQWFSEERAGQPARDLWDAWDKYAADSSMDPHDYLERQAAKIPAGWHVLGGYQGLHAPPVVARAEDDTLMTVRQVLATLERAGRFVKPRTWSAYVARGQAPQPVKRVGREPLWDPADIRAYVEGRWRSRS